MERSKSERILAIDPGAHCGWAFWDGTHLSSGEWQLKEDSAGKGGYGLVAQTLKRNIRGLHPTAVVYEYALNTRSTLGAMMCGCWFTAIQEYCLTSNIPYEEIHWKTVKTQSGATDKSDSVRKAVAKFGMKAANPAAPHNQADALWILDCVLHPVRDVKKRAPVKRKTPRKRPKP